MPNIMVCYDKSDEAQKALAHAQLRARQFEATLYVVTSQEEIIREETSRKRADRVWEHLEQAEEVLQDIQKRMEAENIVCHTHVSVRGLSPGEDLVRLAEEHDIDLVIIGIKKRSKVGKLIFGSTAQQVILNSPCPVLTIKETYPVVT